MWIRTGGYGRFRGEWVNDDVSILIKWGSIKQGLTEAVLQLSQQLNDSSSKAVAQCQ